MALPTFTTTFVTPIPALSQGVAITPAANAWVNSSWVPIIASMPYNAALASVTFYTGCTGEFEIDIGVGGGPTVIATIHGGNFYADISAPNRQLQFDTGTVLLPLPIDLLTSGQAVQARVRAYHDTLTVGPGHPGWTDWRVRIGVLPHPINATIPTTTSHLKSFNPSTQMPDLLANLTAWVAGSWVNIGTFSADSVLAGWSHATHGGTTASLGLSEWAIDMGVGGTVRYSVHIGLGSNTGYPFIHMLKNPLDIFSSGETLQARLYSNVNSNPVDINHVTFNALYYEKPL